MTQTLKPSERKEAEKVEPPLLAYLGGVAEIRGSLVYAELAYELAKRGNNFKMLIIGPYSADEGEKLKSKVNELGVQKYVEITGRMNQP